MGNRLQAELLWVGQLFAEPGTHYEIPIYQRNYSWRSEHIDQLIDDIWAAAQDSQDYFLGNLIVADKQPVGISRKTYEVIDGQQRLTTLYMLLETLESPRSATITYSSRRSSTEALTRLSVPQDDDVSGILAGYEAINVRVSQLLREDKSRKQFRAFLLDHVQLVRAVLPPQTDLNKYFEIMNTRGQQLEQVDIVKARLMSYLTSEEDDVERQRACMAWIWDACADMDRYIQMTLPARAVSQKDVTDLRTELFGDDWDQLKVGTFANLVPLRPQSQDLGGTLSTSVPLETALAIYARTPMRADDEADDPNRFETPIKFSHLLLHTLTLLRFSENEALEVDGHLDDSRLIRLFDEAFAGLPERERSDRVKSFLETLLRAKFLLDNFVLKREITSTNGDDRAWSLKRLTRAQVASGGRSARGAAFPGSFATRHDDSDGNPADEVTRRILLLQSLLRVTYTSPRTMHWITNVLRLPLDSDGTTQPDVGAEVESRLLAYIRRKVRVSLRDSTQSSGLATERIVFTYLDYLLAKGDGELPPDPGFVFVFRNSVEHFFPQHPVTSPDVVPAVTTNDPEMNSFGNLALITAGVNSELSNALPLEKAHKRNINQSKKLELMAEITKRRRDGWDKTSINDHNTAMRELLEADLNSDEGARDAGA